MRLDLRHYFADYVHAVLISINLVGYLFNERSGHVFHNRGLRQIVVIHIHNSLMLAALFLISSSRLACLCLCGLVAYADKVGRRLVLGCTLSGVTVGILLTSLPNLIGILIGLAVLCSSLFATQIVATAFVGHNANAAKGSAASFYMPWYYTGGFLGPLLCGLSWQDLCWGGCSLSASSQSVSALPLY